MGWIANKHENDVCTFHFAILVTLFFSDHMCIDIDIVLEFG